MTKNLQITSHQCIFSVPARLVTLVLCCRSHYELQSSYKVSVFPSSPKMTSGDAQAIIGYIYRHHHTIGNSFLVKSFMKLTMSSGINELCSSAPVTVKSRVLFSSHSDFQAVFSLVSAPALLLSMLLCRVGAVQAAVG